ncbi:Glycosyltransferase Gtf1 [bioreactor metagenome]|uniref:Glycosyltransferase Gtf1 n=1 Tax=bioreactor metagenome TaxID=1076179 RepID=A0A645B848_9ZZZZ
MKDGSKLKKIFVAVRAYIIFWLCHKHYDILHVHLSSRNSTWRKARFIRKAKASGMRIIIHLHGSEFDIFYRDECNEVQKEKIHVIFSMADKIIALSDDWKMFLLKYGLGTDDKVDVIYNSVLMPDYVKTDYSNRNVLFLGRLGERKGTYDLLKIAPKIIERYPDAHFYLGGDGDVQQIQKICEEQQLQNHIELIGWVKDQVKEDYFKRCCIYILPSYAEGMPMSVLEAMSYGLACVSTTVGGIPNIITNKANGLLFTPGNTDDFFNCLDYLFSNEDNRQRIGTNGRKRIDESFNNKKYILDLVQYYNKLLQ